MVSSRLYVEGGGNNKALRTKCRQGFVSFLENAGVSGKMPRIVACGGRSNAFSSFRSAYENGNDSATLLVDAEGPVTANGPWQHLKARDGWDRPKGATDEQCHLMVQMMESWFLADVEALESYYGQGFRVQSLPKNPDIERVPKNDVEGGLKLASRDTGKSEYNKGRDSFEILERLDPAKVMAASGYAKRFVKALL